VPAHSLSNVVGSTLAPPLAGELATHTGSVSNLLQGCAIGTRFIDNLLGTPLLLNRQAFREITRVGFGGAVRLSCECPRKFEPTSGQSSPRTPGGGVRLRRGVRKHIERPEYLSNGRAGTRPRCQQHRRGRQRVETSMTATATRALP
jgi:hypothetical protein